MNAPLVTIYIPCRNYGCFLREAVESVLTQSFTDWELFLVDEASDDDSLNIMQEYATRYDDRISIISHNMPHGLQRTANEVLGLARGRYFIRLDADDWFDEAALLILVSRLESNERLGIAWGNYYYTDVDGKVIGVEHASKPGAEPVSPLIAPHGACTMVRTRALKSVGGYSEDIDAQDGWELWNKLLNQVDATSVASAIFYYRQHGSSLSRDAERLLRARTQIFEKLAKKQDSGYDLSVLAVIGVREDYPGNAGVPYQKIKGVSLLEHTLKSTIEAQGVGDVMVSSKSEQVLTFSEELEMNRRVGPHLRRLRKTQEQDDKLPVQEILVDAGRYFQERKGYAPDIVVFCGIHSIYRTASHLDTAINVLRLNRFDSVVSVEDERSVLFGIGEHGLKLVNPGRLQALQFEHERIFRFNGALIAVWWDVLETGSLLGDRIGQIEMSAAESRQNIPVVELYAQGFAGRSQAEAT